MRLNITDGHAADDGGGTLAARVAARVGQHRDVGGQHGHGGKGILIPADDHAGEGGRNHQEQQPRRAVFVQFPHRLFKIRLVRRAHSVHLGNIFAGLVLHDRDSVVNRDDTDQSLLVVHNGNGQVAVLLEHLGDVLLVGGRADADDIVVHHVADQLVVWVLGQNQRAQRDGADEGAVTVRNVAVVDGFLVKAVLADGRHGLRHRPVGAQLHQFGGHHAAGGVLGVFEQFVDHAAGRGVCLRQNTLDDVGGHFLDQIRRIIDEQVVHNGLQLLISQAVDKVLLGLGGKLGENLRRQVLGTQAEQHGELLGREVLEHGGQVGRGQGGHNIAQALVLFGIVQVGQHRAEGQDRGIRHKKAASFSGGSQAHLILGNAKQSNTVRLFSRTVCFGSPDKKVVAAVIQDTSVHRTGTGGIHCDNHLTFV